MDEFDNPDPPQPLWYVVCRMIPMSGCCFCHGSIKVVRAVHLVNVSVVDVLCFHVVTWMKVQGRYAIEMPCL